MRIGLEMFGTQTDGRHRGIGRYVANLAAALADLAPGRGHEVVFYAEDGPPVDLVPVRDGATLRRLRPAPTVGDAVARLAAANPDRLDALVFLNPVELTPGHALPARPAAPGLMLGGVVYDFIPLHFPREYLDPAPPGFKRRYLQALERLRTFDRLLAISESTRADALARLDLPADRVVTVGAACGARGFAFTPGDTPDDRDAVAALGVSRPFVLSVGATDPRKNLAGLVEAFASLPAGVRASHQLAVAGRLAGHERDTLVALAARHGLAVGPGADVVPTGPAPDAALRALYRGCAAFAFPSRFEGFGLPVLEALACGAPVVAGDNSSQPEAAGRAALLVDASDTGALAAALGRLLTEPELAAALRRAGPPHAREFSWAAVASRTFESLESLGARRAAAPLDRLPPVCVGSAVRTGSIRKSVRTADPTADRGVQSPGGWGGVLDAPVTRVVSTGASRTPPQPPRPEDDRSSGSIGGHEPSSTRPRVALVAAAGAERSAFTAALMHALRGGAAVDLFHAPGAVPLDRVAARRGGGGCYDHRVLDRLDRLRPYAAVLCVGGAGPALPGRLRTRAVAVEPADAPAAAAAVLARLRPRGSTHVRPGLAHAGYRGPHVRPRSGPGGVAPAPVPGRTRGVR